MCGGQDGLGDNGSGADDGGDGLGNHVSSWESSSADNQWGMDSADSMVGDDASETTGSSGSDSQNGGENSLWENSTCNFQLIHPLFIPPPFQSHPMFVPVPLLILLAGNRHTVQSSILSSPALSLVE